MTPPTAPRPPVARAGGLAAGERSPRLLILDSHGIIFRSYFALRDVLTVRSTGEPVSAVYGYANSLLTVLDELEPTHVIAAWDAASATFRRGLDEGYKAHRPPTPPDLLPQFERVRELLGAFQIPLVERPGFEADDVLGTFASQASAQGIETILVTMDNDLVQLVDEHVRVYMYRPYQRDYVMYDEAAVRDRWSFEPVQMVDYKALVGDASDNIPGVKGIGEKGARALIARWGSLEAMIEHIDEIAPARAQKALAAGIEQGRLSRQLATIVRDVPGLELTLDSAELANYDRERVRALFQELDFHSLVRRLPPSRHDAPGGQRECAPEDVDYQLVAAPQELRSLVARVREEGRFSFHVVADDAHPIRARDSLVGISIACTPGQAWYVPLPPEQAPAVVQQPALLAEPDERPAGGPPASPLPRAAVMEALSPLFADGELGVVGHDAKFGLLALAGSGFPVPLGAADFDTQVAAYLVGDPNISLERLALSRLGLETVDTRSFLGRGRQAIGFSQARVADIVQAASQQADYTLRAAEPLRDELESSELATVFRDIDLPHIPVLARMEQFGIALETDVLTDLARELSEQIALAQQDSYQAVGHEFRLGSPQELSTVLFEELKLPRTRKTRTGYTTDAAALEAMRQLHPVIESVLRWRELTKIKSTYVDSLPGQINPRTGRVHTVFSQSTAATGRLSSNHPNLQNIPVRTLLGQRVREAFVARDCGPDPLFLSVDYSQIELRVLADLAGDDELRRAFHEGQDIHTATAASIFGGALADVTADQRRRAKVFNFGVLYGLTAFGLSQREGIDPGEAQAFIDAYFSAYPAVQQWREQTVAEARERGFAETLSGRRRPIPDLHATNFNRRSAAERIAINMPIQGTASDIIKIAMNRIDAELRERQRRGKRARLVLQVHDELIFELPESELAEVREIAQRLMPSLPLAVPLDLDERVGPSWGDLAAIP